MIGYTIYTILRLLGLKKKRRSKKGSFGFGKFMIGLAVITIVIGGVLDTYNQPRIIEYVRAETVQAVEVVPQEVQIEIAIDWTRERIEQEVDRVFPDAPIIKKVITCESDYKINAFNPTNRSNDEGLLQISEKYHKAEYTRLGFTDMKDPKQNLAFGRILYDRNGLNDWVWSKHCWNK